MDPASRRRPHWFQRNVKLASPMERRERRRDILGIGLVLLLVAAGTLPELVLLGADHGLWGSLVWRAWTYQHGAFWAGLLQDWRPLYDGQIWLMFLTHGLLHADSLHMAMNMVTLLSLGLPLVRRLGAGRFLAIHAASQLGGGLGFGLLGPLTQPMVGASGALFGLAAAWIVVLREEAAGEGVWADLRLVVAPTLFLILLNAVMYAANAGQLAWEAHLGGFLAGALVTLLLLPRASAPRR